MAKLGISSFGSGFLPFPVLGSHLHLLTTYLSAAAKTIKSAMDGANTKEAITKMKSVVEAGTEVKSVTGATDIK